MSIEQQFDQSKDLPEAENQQEQGDFCKKLKSTKIKKERILSIKETLKHQYKMIAGIIKEVRAYLKINPNCGTDELCRKFLFSKQDLLSPRQVQTVKDNIKHAINRFCIVEKWYPQIQHDPVRFLERLLF